MDVSEAADNLARAAASRGGEKRADTPWDSLVNRAGDVWSGVQPAVGPGLAGAAIGGLGGYGLDQLTSEDEEDENPTQAALMGALAGGGTLGGLGLAASQYPEVAEDWMGDEGSGIGQYIPEAAKHYVPAALLATPEAAYRAGSKSTRSLVNDPNAESRLARGARKTMKKVPGGDKIPGLNPDEPGTFRKALKKSVPGAGVLDSGPYKDPRGAQYFRTGYEGMGKNAPTLNDPERQRALEKAIQSGESTDKDVAYAMRGLTPDQQQRVINYGLTGQDVDSNQRIPRRGFDWLDRATKFRRGSTAAAGLAGLAGVANHATGALSGAGNWIGRQVGLRD